MSELVVCFGKPAAIRLDNGPELTADAFTTWAKEQGIELRFNMPPAMFKPRVFQPETSSFNLYT